ncbi:LuxR family transcriptional regulator [Paucibacter oligotrophus]|uniref:LuxR family transcriptional regulator n=1 Tax=Roseateles oligotrophus TaxID=1769250 RepID=A0A840L8W7_9BURK|nr:LuxR family transcriptional regulator [Roseateles oligotrophus]MBB4843203.1 LuxR family transcriptional regulator [Roseateles oligotrophus]
MDKEDSTVLDDNVESRAAFEQIAEFARELGFEHCCHGLRMPVPVTRPRTVFYTNYPPEWERLYRERGYLEIDPTVLHGMRSSSAIVWSDEFFSTVPEFWQTAQSYGLRYGWAQSRRDPEGIYSMLVLARSGPALDIEELRDKEERLSWLLGKSHFLAKQACSDPVINEKMPLLSGREVEVLRWSADGKSAAIIAALMNISERTVAFHINSVVQKLGVNNKTSAVARASMLGLLW